MSSYTDKNGYLRDRYGELIHRKIAYNHLYVKNKEKYDKPFSEYVIHHKDENKKNNNIDNLELLTSKEHNKVHGFVSTRPRDNKHEGGFFFIIIFFFLGYVGWILINHFYGNQFKGIVIVLVYYFFLISWFIGKMREKLVG